MSPRVQPLSYRHRNVFFYLLVGIFVGALPFLFLYASGYRFSFGESGLVSTGGLYVAAEKTGAQIYINDELVRETRVFRRAFYSQGLEAGTHKVHVQKPEHHTWVKELPVYAHLVTEAQAFNLPLVPEVRVITPWRTGSGVAVLMATSTLMAEVKIANQYLLEPRAATSTMTANTEYDDLIKYFDPTTDVEPNNALVERMRTTIDQAATSSMTLATTTKEWRGVRLYEAGGEVHARYIGNRSSMPYYYCAETFMPYEPKTATTTPRRLGNTLTAVAEANTGALSIDPSLEVQTVADSKPCDPVITIDRKGEAVSYFDFFPNSTDLVVLGLYSGIYLSEIDDRAWQNQQPLLSGADLEVRVINGGIYAYDGQNLYQVLLSQNWF